MAASDKRKKVYKKKECIAEVLENSYIIWVD